MSDVIVVGGGVLGLTLGWRLRQQGHRVRVLEAAAEPGGLASADPIGGVRWDRFYHVILGQDRHLLRLLQELDLTPRLRWGTTRTGFYVDGRWHSLSSALDFLRFPPLSLVDKARLGATIMAAARIRDGAAMEAETSVDWLTRWSGRRTVEQIWLPLLRSKLGANAERASAAFIWAIIQRMYGARSRGNKREAMGYVLGGYDTIVKSLVAGVTRGGLELMASDRVRAVTTSPSGCRVTLASGEVLTSDEVVMTIPCGAIASVCSGLREEESARLRRVTYQGVVCPSYLLRRPLKGYYVTNITDPSIPFTGVIETTALVDPRSLGGHLVYLPRYLTQDDPRWNDSDDQVADECFAALQRMVPDLSVDDVIARRVARARDVLAVSTLHYSSDLMPPVRTSQPRLFVVNSAQIAHGTLNVDESVQLAERGARELAALIGTGEASSVRIDSPAVFRGAHV